MALFGRALGAGRCPLIGVKQTSSRWPDQSFLTDIAGCTYGKLLRVVSISLLAGEVLGLVGHPGGQLIRNCVALLISDFPNGGGKSAIWRFGPVPRGAARDRHGRGAGCGGRGSVGAQMESQGGSFIGLVSVVQHADERRMLRTEKSCGPDAPTLASSLRRRVPAQPGQTCRQSASDGGKQARSPGRARRKPLKPLRREGRVSRRTLGDYARVLHLNFAREAAGASGTRLSLRPLSSEGQKIGQTSDAWRRENAGVCLISTNCHTLGP